MLEKVCQYPERSDSVENTRVCGKLSGGYSHPQPAQLNFSKPSVSIAMKKLRENGYVEINELGHITLTPAGQEIAERIYERHTFLSAWLIDLGVDPMVAAEDACRMEHVISAETFDAIRTFVRERQ